VGELLEALERAGELERTVVVMTGDHGMPFPRCKGNLYDCGARVPLAMRWPGVIRPGRAVEDFVSVTDLAPTFLGIAGLEPPAVMTGTSLLEMLRGSGNDGEKVELLQSNRPRLPIVGTSKTGSP